MIALRGIQKTYPDAEGHPLQVLTGVDLTVAEGEMLAVVGPSGCGKSTLLNIVGGMANVWVFVKWPLIVQARAKEDYGAIRKLLSQRIWLQNLSFLAGAIPLVLLGPWLIARLGTDKEMLPVVWLGLLALTVFLDLHFTVWGTYFSTGNVIPSLWPAVITNVASLGLSLSLIHFTSLGLGGLVLGPLIAGSVFNYWYWPLAGAKALRSSFWAQVRVPRLVLLRRSLLRGMRRWPGCSITATRRSAWSPAWRWTAWGRAWRCRSARRWSVRARCSSRPAMPRSRA